MEECPHCGSKNGVYTVLQEGSITLGTANHVATMKMRPRSKGSMHVA